MANKRKIFEENEIKEVELELPIAELKLFADYCIRHDLKFNDWIRSLALQAIKEENKEQ